VDARNYIVIIGGIKRASIVKACATGLKVTEKIEFSASASDCVVASKSISDASIEYFLYPRHGDNIILLSKR
jgi:hypothetical protein